MHCLSFRRDPADKLIRHRACSLRDNAYALIKAELDSDFEDKCREISKSRKVTETCTSVNKVDKNSKVDSTPLIEKNEKKENSQSTGGLVLNGRKFPSSRKRRIPAWARGYVKKAHKKKKIAFEDSPCDSNTPKPQNGEPSSGKIFFF